MIENSLVPANEIWYTTTDGKTIKGRMDTPKKSNTYKKDGKGVMVFKEPVVEIGGSAFSGCKSLHKIVIPEGVTEIGGSAFSGCKSLHKIVIPEGVTEIKWDAFYGCESLQEVVIPKSVTKIWNHAFAGCKSLTNITIPNSVTNIENGAFDSCTSLESIVVVEGNPVYDSREGCNAIIETATNTLIYGGNSTIIPESVTKIGGSAFYERESLQEVVIPEGVTEIGGSTFYGCKSLHKVVIPEGVTEIGGSAFYGCKSLHKVVIPKSVTKIVNGAFNIYTSLESIVVVEGNPVYDSREGCNAIIETATNTLIVGCKSTIIPESVTKIGKEAFYGCKSLQEIVIPSSVTSIEEKAFYNCSSLEFVHLQAEVASLKIDSFWGYDNLKAIYVPGNKVDYYKECFPSNMHWLIVEEGSALPNKTTALFFAKDISFAPKLRVIVPKGESDDYILSVAEKLLEKYSKSQIIKWVINNLNSIADSKVPYDAKKDK